MNEAKNGPDRRLIEILSSVPHFGTILLLVFTHVINSHVFQRKQEEAFA